MHFSTDPGGDVTTALAPNRTAMTAADRCDRGPRLRRRGLIRRGIGFERHIADPADQRDLPHRLDQETIEAGGALFHDETDRLVETPASASPDER